MGICLSMSVCVCVCPRKIGSAYAQVLAHVCVPVCVREHVIRCMHMGV